MLNRCDFLARSTQLNKCVERHQNPQAVRQGVNLLVLDLSNYRIYKYGILERKDEKPNNKQNTIIYFGNDIHQDACAVTGVGKCANYR